ncbi:MAG TPA: YidC/Oxa1 family membrane protein insertase [Acidimicrobiales bacterium]|nr:YidC/Oxa1 family membrane protein insertase [Acidimicrobiales bacterium]
MTALSNLVGWVLAGFYSLIPNYAFAIIMLGLTFMVLVVPLTLKSTRSMLAMQALQPKLKQLQQQHKNDRLAMNQALTELYKEEGVSPFGSCLPSLIPLPLFYVLYRVISGLTHVHCNAKKGSSCFADPLYLSKKTKMFKDLVASAPAHSLYPGKGASIHSWGLNLGTNAIAAIEHHLGAGQIFGTLFLLLIMVAANYYQQVQITNLNPMVARSQEANPQMRFMRIFPIFFGLICIRLPAGLVLYYAVSALFRVGQQWMMYKFDPQVKALVNKDAKDLGVIEAKLEQSNRRRAEGAAAAAKQPVLDVRDGRNGRARQPGSSGNGRSGKLPGGNVAAGGATGAPQNRNRRRKGR